MLAVRDDTKVLHFCVLYPPCFSLIARDHHAASTRRKCFRTKSTVSVSLLVILSFSPSSASVFWILCHPASFALKGKPILRLFMLKCKYDMSCVIFCPICVKSVFLDYVPALMWEEWRNALTATRRFSLRNYLLCRKRVSFHVIEEVALRRYRHGR
jgi:hypothetical protein